MRGNILKRFDDSCLNSFDVQVIGTELEARYQNIIINRDLAAHGRVINITFDELIQSHQVATGVLQALSNALNL